MPQNSIPDYFVYGEPSRPVAVGFLHVETVRARNNVHLGRVAAHRHAQMAQITFWTSGTGSYSIEDQVWHFSAPTVSFVPSTVVHGFAIEPNADAIVVSIADDMLAPLAAQTALPLDVPVFVAGGGEAAVWQRLAGVLETIAAEYRDSGGADEKILPGLIAAALSYIARLNTLQPSPMAAPAVSLALALRRAVDRHYRENWPVDRYVDLLGTTPHVLDKAARQVLGRSVKDVLLERRLVEAKRLLLFTIRPVEDVAFEIGFGDPAYFSRFFRKRTGEAPSAWRARKAGQDRSG